MQFLMYFLQLAQMCMNVLHLNNLNASCLHRERLQKREQKINMSGNLTVPNQSVFIDINEAEKLALEDTTETKL